MSWWIVNYIPSWVLLTGLIVLIAGGAALLQRYVRRRFPVLNGDAHNDVTKFTYGFIGFVYAFFIGFVVSSMWGQNNAADGNARAEGAAAAQMARDAVVFDTADKDRIRQSLLTYEHAAIAEWDAGRPPTAHQSGRSLGGLGRTASPHRASRQSCRRTPVAARRPTARRGPRGAPTRPHAPSRTHDRPAGMRVPEAPSASCR